MCIKNRYSNGKRSQSICIFRDVLLIQVITAVKNKIKIVVLLFCCVITTETRKIREIIGFMCIHIQSERFGIIVFDILVFNLKFQKMLLFVISKWSVFATCAKSFCSSSAYQNNDANEKKNIKDLAVRNSSSSK